VARLRFRERAAENGGGHFLSTVSRRLSIHVIVHSAILEN
jgi:hypothetical protein